MIENSPHVQAYRCSMGEKNNEFISLSFMDAIFPFKVENEASYEQNGFKYMKK